MSKMERKKGYLRKVENPKGLNLEDLCKEICKTYSLTTLPKYFSSFQDLLLEEQGYDKYIILDNQLFIIEETKDIDLYSSYCHIQKQSDGRYIFDTQFYNGGASLSEMLENKWNQEEHYDK